LNKDLVILDNRLKMEFNFSTDSSTLTSTQLSNTTTIIYSDRLFFHTFFCQAIAGIFTLAAILITGHHVK
jgi:hypothetical protein